MDWKIIIKKGKKFFLEKKVELNWTGMEYFFSAYKQIGTKFAEQSNCGAIRQLEQDKWQNIEKKQH